MNISPVAVDLAKNVFEIAIADRSYHIIERQRLSRSEQHWGHGFKYA